MAILACGVNHNTAPLSVRERISVSDHSHDSWMRQLAGELPISEAAILSTCNRTELYCETAELGSVIDWLSQRYRFESGAVKDFLYVHQDYEAVRHMMRVACGLDSMVLGESQILGQIKQAYKRASHIGMVGPQLSALFRHVFTVSKRVRTETGIGAFPVSIAYASTMLAKKLYTNLAPKRVLVIGAGKTALLAARHFHQQGVRQFIVANRSQRNADGFAKEFSAKAIVLSEIPEALHETDIVIAATSSPLPLVTQSMVESALSRSKRRMMMMLDLGVPRDIEASVQAFDDVFLYNIDDMQGICNEGLSERKDAAREAECIIELELDNFIRWHRAQGSVEVIKAYRTQMEVLAEAELDRARKLLQSGESADEVLEDLSRRLVNKLMHRTSTRLRRAGFEGRDDLLMLAQYLYSEDL